MTQITLEQNLAARCSSCQAQPNAIRSQLSINQTAFFLSKYFLYGLPAGAKPLLLVLTVFLMAVPAFSAAVIVNSTSDTGDTFPGDGTCTTSSGSCTLRAAIQETNALAGADIIAFGISGGGLQTIIPATELPLITDTVTIDGFTQPGSTFNAPLIELNGNAAGTVNGLTLSNVNNCLIRGLVINRFATFLGTVTGNGIVIRGTSSNNRIQGNFLGTDSTGTVDLGNGFAGVWVFADSHSNFVGTDGDGTNDANEGNLISGNDFHGVELSNPPDIGTNDQASLNRVAGNRIGTDRNGLADLGNRATGVKIFSSSNLVGTDGNGISDTLERNVISGNDCIDFGTLIVGGLTITGERGGADNNVVTGNLIGTNINGAAAPPNGRTGMYIDQGAINNTIGGTDQTRRNVISGNLFQGIFITDAATTGNLIQGNFIGINLAGDAGIPNGAGGIALANGTTGTSIGGTAAGAGNAIAFNSGDGVVITGAAVLGSSFLGNSIFSNGGLGIDLGNDGVTPNDPIDADTGANNLQNYPIINFVYSGSTGIGFTLNSAPNTTFRVEFFGNAAADSSGFGEGRTFLGFTNVTTDAGGNVTSTFTSPITTPVGQFVSATATDPLGNTSEFSPARAVLDPTAAAVTVAGRVMTSDGRGIYGARVFIFTASGNARSVRTNSFGYYRFEEVETGQTYLLEVRHKQDSFTPRLISLLDEILNLDIFAEPPGESP